MMDKYDRYSRQIMLDRIGLGGQEKLSGAKVCVVGAGGLGSPVALQLAMMGVNSITIIDRDVIELSNLHRQTLYREADVGMPKAPAAARLIGERNSGCKVNAVVSSINDANADGLLGGHDLVLDAVDNVEARYAINRSCIRLGIPLVSGAALGTTGMAFSVLPGDRCYQCVVPDEGRDSPTCGMVGVHPSVLTLVSSMMTREAEGIITEGKAALRNRFQYVELNTGMGFKKIPAEKRPDCPACVLRERPAGAGITIEDICGRDGGRRTFAITPESPMQIDIAAATERAAGLGYKTDLRDGVLHLEGRSVIELSASGSAIITGITDKKQAETEYLAIRGAA